MTEESNPFSSLLGSQNDPAVPSKQSIPESTSSISQDLVDLNKFIQDVFYFTIDPKTVENTPNLQLIFLEELSESLKPQNYIDMETLEQALFERLLLSEPEKSVIPKNQPCSDYIVQNKLFSYLYTVYENLGTFSATCKSKFVQGNVKNMYELIYRNCITAMKQPQLFEDQQLHVQMIDLLRNFDTNPQRFVTDVVEAFMNDDDTDSAAQLKEFMGTVLWKLTAKLHMSNIVTLDVNVMPIVQMFASNKYLAPILLANMTPRDPSNGLAYQASLVGSLMVLSVLPKLQMGKYEFFDNPLDQSSVNLMEQSIWNATKYLTDGLHKVFLTLLKNSPETKEHLLSWIGNCLKANQGRGKLWNVEAMELTQTTVPDGFMLNLSTVLLKLCQPFCNRSDDPKALKIDPTYCAVQPSEAAAKSVHMTCLHEATCLLPARDGEEGEPWQRPTAETYNFLTECFFMAHASINLGFHVCSEKMTRLGQEIARAQRALGIPVVAERLKILMKRFVSLRCALFAPESVSLLSRLHAVTSYWLVQVAMRNNPDSPAATYAPLEQMEIKLPLTTTPPDTLSCIPELVVENVTSLISLARRSDSISETDASVLYPPALTLVITFMGDAERMNNPHLRARMAECLEAMLPSHPDDDQPAYARESSLATYFKEQLFKEHPHRSQLMPSLLDVFVGIEMTGQNVQFEQKFNYRRPMYIVMDFLWEIQEHKDCLTRLARDAESNMEAVRPPLFLRFVNLLMNDAIFLLDEALSNMAQIKTLQAAKESGEWDRLSAHEREQNLANLAHIGMLARFDNILGRDTIRTLSRMTSHAPYVFCHRALADRIAAMLNYFLLHLVGPNKNTFKVKDGKEYEFNPAQSVMEICRMYVQLGADPNFCLAVSQDGRSYSPKLFPLAEDVLVRIGGGSLIGELQEFATRVATIARTKEQEDVLLADAPDHFLDPIMSTLMLDPVILPSSRTTVDRTTIARHLLSDESDPFNRSPLTMDQVKPNLELKAEIDAWIAERKRGCMPTTSEEPMDQN